MAERGISVHVMAAVYHESDLMLPGEKGCIHLLISNPKLKKLAARGEQSESMRHIAIVLHAATDRVITVYRLGCERRRQWGALIARGDTGARPNG